MAAALTSLGCPSTSLMTLRMKEWRSQKWEWRSDKEGISEESVATVLGLGKAEWKKRLRQQSLSNKRQCAVWSAPNSKKSYQQGLLPNRTSPSPKTTLMMISLTSSFSLFLQLFAAYLTYKLDFSILHFPRTGQILAYRALRALTCLSDLICDIHLHPCPWVL